MTIKKNTNCQPNERDCVFPIIRIRNSRNFHPRNFHVQLKMKSTKLQRRKLRGSHLWGVKQQTIPKRYSISVDQTSFGCWNSLTNSHSVNLEKMSSWTQWNYFERKVCIESSPVMCSGHAFTFHFKFYFSVACRKMDAVDKFHLIGSTNMFLWFTENIENMYTAQTVLFTIFSSLSLSFDDRIRITCQCICHAFGIFNQKFINSFY